MANTTLKFGNGEWYGKEDTILAYNDENKNFKPLPFDFERGSTATRINKEGLIETVGANEPRVDYKDDSKGAMLLEPSRTNSLPYSENFSQGYTLSNTSIISNDVISPEGVQNATKIYPLSSGNFRHIKYNPLNPSSGLHTFSLFAKAGELEHLVLIDYDGSGVGIHFNLSNGVATDNATNPFDSFDMIDYGNGWYRCIATATNPYFYWMLSDNGGISVTANGNDGLYIWGFQAEANSSYPTSYIPTQGEPETRLVDTCTNGGNEQVINSTEGVLYAEIKSFISYDAIDPNRYITLTNGTSNERIALLLGGNSNQLRAIAYSNTQSINLSFTTSLTDTKQYNKLAVKYKSGDYAFFLNGVKIGGSSETNIFSANTLNDLSFDVGGGTQQFRGIVKGLRVYNTALSDQELIALTQV